MNTYNEILKLYTGNEDLRLWLNEPFKIEGKVMATDCSSLVAFDASKIDTEKIQVFEKAKINGVYPIDKEFEQRITFEQLTEFLKLVPIVDDFDEKYETVECKECEGSGEVEYVYESKSRKDYTYDHDCPICDGEGTIGDIIKVPNGRKINDPDSACKIKNYTFKIRQINRLYETMKLLGNKDLILLNQTTESKSNLFAIEDIEIIVMPAICEDAAVSFHIA